MIRNLKAVGLLAFAALAMSAMFASAASAQEEPGTFTAGTTPGTHEPATLVGHQDAEVGDWNFFQRGESKIRCHEAEFTGTDGDGTATELMVTPQFRHCYDESSEGTLPTTVTTEGCYYVFKRPTTDPNLGPGRYTGKVDLTCTDHEVIVYYAYAFGNSTETSHFFNVCTTEISPNATETVGGHTTHELAGHVIYIPFTMDGHDGIYVKATLGGITSFSNCPGGPEHDTEGTYTSTIQLGGVEDDEAEHTERLDAWISDEEE